MIPHRRGNIIMLPSMLKMFHSRFVQRESEKISLHLMTLYPMCNIINLMLPMLTTLHIPYLFLQRGGGVKNCPYVYILWYDALGAISLHATLAQNATFSLCSMIDAIITSLMILHLRCNTLYVVPMFKTLLVLFSERTKANIRTSGASVP